MHRYVTAGGVLVGQFAATVAVASTLPHGMVLPATFAIAVGAGRRFYLVMR